MLAVTLAFELVPLPGVKLSMGLADSPKNDVAPPTIFVVPFVTTEMLAVPLGGFARNHIWACTPLFVLVPRRVSATPL
jgi:hypothetical protein